MKNLSLKLKAIKKPTKKQSDQSLGIDTTITAA